MDNDETDSLMTDDDISHGKSSNVYTNDGKLTEIQEEEKSKPHTLLSQSEESQATFP